MKRHVCFPERIITAISRMNSEQNRARDTCVTIIRAVVDIHLSDQDC